MAIRRGWLIFFIILGLFVFFGLMFIIGIRAALEDKPVVKEDTVLRLDLAGLITEHYPRSAFAREMEGARLQMHDIRKALTMAKVDERIRGLYLDLSNPDLGWAKAQEIRHLIADFKESGKFVTAFMQTCNEGSYYIALSADELYLQPHSYVEFNGFASEVPFLKGTFNKLGMEPQVENIGKYKSAGDMLKRESMSPAHREVTETLLNRHYEEFVQTVCERRGLERSEFEEILEEGVYRSEGALEHKLVDSLEYETAVRNLLKEKVYGGEGTDGKDQELRMISISRYARVPADEVGLGRGEQIALIYAIGTIVPGHGDYNPLMGRNMGSSAIVSLLREAKDNADIRAVVLRVDSPGGSALASDVIWAEIEKVQEEKPVVISMSDVAASGGYWISMGSDAIVAHPLTLTGSIGVVGAIFDLSGTYDKLGMNWAIVKTNEHADMMTDKRPMTDEEWETFRENTRDIYDTFVQKVADGRDKTWDAVHEIAQGRVWTGEQALEIGLVDSLGGLDAALTIAKREADIAADAKTQWVVFPKPKGFFQSLMERFNVRVVRHFAKKSQEWVILQNLPKESREALKQIAIASLARRGTFLAIEPYVPVIR